MNKKESKGLAHIAHYLYMALAVLTLAFATAACSDDNTSDLQLSGNCSVEALALDQYEGIIDATARTITVRVPETYDTQEMAVTALQLSNGAKADKAVGDKLNMSVAQTIHVTNGDVFLDWTLQAVRDEARILSFKLNDTYVGSIDEDAKTISVYVPADVDVTKLVPNITVSDNATVTPQSGTPVNFTNPVEFTVENNSAKAVYTVTVTPIGKPEVVFVGLAQDMSGLNAEEAAACSWMLQTVPNSLYVSFDAIMNGSVDLSECKVVWWHFHKDGTIDNQDKFEAAAPEAVNAAAKLRDLYNGGTAFLLTRYATFLPVYLGVQKDGRVPNNCWGNYEDNPEVPDNGWSFFINGNGSHALYQNLLMTDDTNAVFTFSKGYGVTNTTAQWHIGKNADGSADWGGYADYTAWRNATGATDLGYGGDGAIVVWEWPAAEGKGGVFCIGSGGYDWYSAVGGDGGYHENVKRLTLNAINYLKNK